VSLDDVVAPPYDVISLAEQRALQARSPYNAVRIDLPDGTPGLDPYEAAAHRLAEWQAEGVLRRDAQPSLYGYRMTYFDGRGTRRQTIGVLGSLGLEPPGTAGIFPHERTTPKAKSDRLQLLETTKVNTSPIWALSLAKGLSDEVVPPAATDAVVDGDGVSHELWPITDAAAIGRITEAVSAAPVVIADGHHRFETALTYQGERRASDGPAGDHDYDSVMALVVELVDGQLSVHGIHRLIGGMSGDVDIVTVLSRFFELTPTEPADATILDRMERAGAPALVTTTGAWLLHAMPATIDAAGQDLDSSRLEVALAALPAHELTYQHGWDLAVGAVGRGEAQAAVLLRPVTVDQIASTGRGGERMPPKTTFFWPKPRTGLVFREVAD